MDTISESTRQEQQKSMADFVIRDMILACVSTHLRKRNMPSPKGISLPDNETFFCERGKTPTTLRIYSKDGTTDFLIEVKRIPERISNMEEVRAIFNNGTKIKEWLCPNYDLEKPTKEDLALCENGLYCENHWGCHTFRHFNGTRGDDDGKV